ncbi:unnamed protein product [Rhodiola kirilowii]
MSSAQVCFRPVRAQSKPSSIAQPNAKKRKRDPIKPNDSDCVLLEPVILNPEVVQLSEAVENMIRRTLEGLENGSGPVRTSEGTGGAYFMKDSSGEKIVSVFKPVDEEPNAVNNPNGLNASSVGEGLKKGTKVGEGALREVAAYLLDKKGFAGVPPTFMVKCLSSGFNHREEECKAKFGSLQKFAANNVGSCEDMGPGAFPVSEVHKISVLDIRMANADRHAGNILISKVEEDGHTVLIPIDHGYCLPESFEDCTFEWLYWPQARQPYSPETLEYIETLDAEEDISILKLYGWDMSEQCARTLRVSTMLLKKGAERGLSSFAIGSIMCREKLDKPSMLEEILQEAEGSVNGSDEAALLDSLSRIIDRCIARSSPQVG